MPWRNPQKVPVWTLLATSWFALALLVLFLLGLAFVAVLTVWGEWLEENWNLTFPSPLPWVELPGVGKVPLFWMLFALFPLLILLLYFLKLRRRALQVPSTFLWRKSIEDLHVNSLFQWLRRNVLLILQLLILLFLGYGLANATYNSEARGRHIILMIDNSASMAATDEPPTRLAAAKRAAHQRIDALDPSDQAMVIAFSSEAQILQSYTNRKDDLHRAVDLIEQTHRPTQLELALDLAAGQANPRRSAEDAALGRPEGGGTMPRTTLRAEGVATDVYLFSDGKFPDVTDFDLGRLNVRLQSIGRSSRNVGIVWASLRRDPDTVGEFEVSVRVLNYEPRPIAEGQLAVRLDVFPAGAPSYTQQKPLSLVARTDREGPAGTDGQKPRVEVPGRSIPEILTFTFQDPGSGYVRLSLRDTQSGGAWRDDFPLDDVAWLAVAPVRRARVLRIGPPNDILDAILKASVSQQKAVVTSLAPADFQQSAEYRRARLGEAYDLVFFDRCAPDSLEAMPQANTCFLGSAPPLKPKLWETMEPMRFLSIVEFRHTYPLLRGIETLQGMFIRNARALPDDALPLRAVPLLETQKKPVAWALGRDRYTDLVLTFPLVEETEPGKPPVWNMNWPNQPPGTFPLFFDNVITQLGRYTEYEEAHRPGRPKLLDVAVPVNVVQVSRREPAGGRSETIKREGNQELAYAGTDTVGLYEVAWDGAVRYRFGVNLFDVNESSIQPREEVRVGVDEVRKTEEPLRKRQELWPWFIGAALSILLLEWFLYNRRIFV
jgi:hypothetical protein